jgi:hypothetical protein
MKMAVCSAALAALCFVSFAAAEPDRTPAAEITDAKDPKFLTAQTRKQGGVMPPEQLALDFRHLDLSTKVFPDEKRIESTAVLTLGTSMKLAELILDLYPKFTIHRIEINGRAVAPAQYSNPEGQLIPRASSGSNYRETSTRARRSGRASSIRARLPSPSAHPGKAAPPGSRRRMGNRPGSILLYGAAAATC